MVTGFLVETDCTISWEEALNSIKTLHPTLESRAAELSVSVRHEVAQFECTRVVTWSTPALGAGTLRRRATVALMTGCEALRTMYRIGFEW